MDTLPKTEAENTQEPEPRMPDPVVRLIPLVPLLAVGQLVGVFLIFFLVLHGQTP